MNSRLEEESKALSNRQQWPSKLSEEQLTKLKLALAEQYGFAVDSDNAFVKTSDEWIEMEEALGRCYFAVFNNYQTPNMQQPATALFMLSPTLDSHFQLWVTNEQGAFQPISQADEVRFDA